MSLEIVSDSRLISRIKQEKDSFEGKSYIDMINDAFRDYHILQLGGTIRDAVISEFYGVPFQFRDWDFIVDDSSEEVDLFEVCGGLPGEVGKNHYDAVKWKISGFEFDITKYSSRDNVKSLEEFFSGCDFNIGTIAYSHEHGKILSLNALEGIRDRKIVLMKPDDRIHTNLVRAVNFERKLGFELDEDRTLRYIRKNYNPELNSDISEYIKYKGMNEGDLVYILHRLTEICGS